MNTDATTPATDPQAQFAAFADHMATVGHNLMVAVICAAVIGFIVMAYSAMNRTKATTRR